MSEVGKKFKAAREKRGISIQEVGLSLKINPRVIAAIESGEREALPARTFLRGFVKSYAQFLRLETKEIMEEFSREYGMETPGTPKAQTPAATQDAPVPNSTGENVSPVIEAASTPQALPSQRPLSDSASIAKENIASESGFPVGKVLLGVVLFAAIVFLAKTVDKYQRERALPQGNDEISEENAVAANKIETSDAEAMASGGTTNTSAVGAFDTVPSVTGALSSEPATGALTSSTSLPAPTGSPSVSPSPLSTPSPSPSPSPKTTPTPKATPSATPSPTPMAKASPAPTPNAIGETLSRPVEVIIEASKTVRVRYDLGNGQWTTIDLAEGGLHTFRSKNPISLDISDAGAVTLIVNGRDRGRPGSAGQSVQLRLRE